MSTAGLSPTPTSAPGFLKSRNQRFKTSSPTSRSSPTFSTPPTTGSSSPSNPRDVHLLTLAIASQASALITLDNDLLTLPSSHADPARRFRQRTPRTRILTPSHLPQYTPHAMTTAMTTPELTSLLAPTSLRPGDTVLLHSSLRALGPAGKSADNLLDAFLSHLTPTGTLAVPTHTWATVSAQQPVFHQTHTPSTVGTLTNVLRLRPHAHRSLHPSHSIAALGARAAELTAHHELDTTPCSPQSPYAKLIDYNAKVALLGVDLRRCTFFHCLEEIAHHDPAFLSPAATPRVLIRHDGTTLHCQAHTHAGNTSEVFPRVELALLAESALEIHPFASSRLLIVHARPAAELLIPLLRNNPKLFQ